MHDDDMLSVIVTLAGQVFPAISTATQTFAHAGAKKEEAIENAARDSVIVAKRILAHALAPQSAAMQPYAPSSAPSPQQAGFLKPQAVPPIVSHNRPIGSPQAPQV